MHPGNEGEADTITVGELVAKLSTYAPDWPIVVRVCSLQVQEVPFSPDLTVTTKNFDCILDPEDIHAEDGSVALCVGNETLEQILGQL